MPGSLVATEPGGRIGPTDSVDELETVADRVDVDPRGEDAEPLGRHLPAGVEVVGRLAVEHHADVDELLALHARDAAQHDVLVGLHAAALPGTHTRAPSRRARRKETYAARTSVGRLGTRSWLEPLVGHLGEHVLEHAPVEALGELGVDGSRAARRASPARGRPRRTAAPRSARGR